MRSILLSVLVLSGWYALAATEPVTGPCLTLKTACGVAGYKPGAHKTGKGLHTDCMKPLLDGKAVAGVKISPTDLNGCKIKMAAHQPKPKAAVPVKAAAPAPVPAKATVPARTAAPAPVKSAVPPKAAPPAQKKLNL